MNAALTAANFAMFALALLLLGVTVMASSRELSPARRAAEAAAQDARHAASLVTCEAFEQAAGARNPLALGRESAVRLAAALASRLGDRHAAVAWCDEIARRLGAGDELAARLSGGRPRQFRTRLDDLEEARTLARLVGSCLAMREQCDDVGRRQMAAQLGTVPLGIVEDFVACALRWGDLVITLVPVRRELAR